MNKFRWSMVGLIAAAAIISVVITIYQNAKQYKTDSGDIAVMDVTGHIKKDEDMEEQTSEIGGVQDETGLTQNSTQEEVMDVMHHMTHQKVIAEEKWGAVEMNSENINAVYEIVVDSDFMLKGDLLNIVTGWKEGNFNSAEEEEFIGNNF